MAKIERIFHFLKAQNKIKSASLEDFSAVLQKPGKLEKVFEYLKSQGAIKTGNIEEFKTSFGLSGGGGEAPSRPLPKDVVMAYREQVRNKNIQPLVEIEEQDPIIYDKEKFLDFYRQKALSKLSPEDQEFYNKSEPEHRDSFLALRGGLPDFEQYQKVVRTYEQSQITNPTDWSKMDSSNVSRKPEGYRYSQGKPARESITKKK